VNKATALFELGRYDEAGAAYDKALALKPGLAEAWLGRGSISIQRKRFDDALADFDKALALKPDLTAASLGRGRAFAYTKRYDEALAAYEKTLALKPDLADAWLGRGNVFTELERYEEALAAYDRALTLKPRLENAWLGRGNVYAALKRYDEAFAAYDEALALKPDLANAWLGRGNVFTSLERYDDALSAYDEALVLKPDLENAWLGLGNLCSSLKRYDKALAAYDKALELKPDFEAAWFGRGNILTDLRRHEDAFIAYDRAFVLDPDLKAVEGARLHAKMQCCDWRNFDKESKSLIASMKNKNPAALPWVLLSISANPQEQLEYAKVWALKNNPAFPSPIWQGEIYKNKKIRVGYVSSDFRSHAVAYLLAGVFESHDRRRFEIFALSTGHDDKSAMRDRLKSAFDEFTDVSDKSDRDIADQIRALNIDILVDLMGYTSDMRLGILTQRPAPVQVAYLGYAGTTGATFVDYLIADRTVIPLSHQMHYVEKIAYLPHCFLPHDVMGRQISDKPLIRSDFGLPERGCVFCCFNNTYKLNPDVFQSWMTIMKATDGSVLWLSELRESAQNNLRKEARAAGVDAGRLVFAKRLASVAEHLARHQLADLFLDTTPYNAHTTASDALWAGLPVLTEIGETFAARVAASLLTDVGLTELIARSRTEYQKLAIELANDPARLAKIKDKLRAGRVTSPLFNTQLFTRHLEGAYEAMYRRYQAGLAPDHITVEDKEESEPGPRDELAAGELLVNEVG
jgi:predicted O-linked N-acetylglucosamine transferase (SPINDLY family)